ncbi:MAG: TetR/AcrR family transcriptional regulator [Vicinamibacterales bacterium]
MARVRRRDSLPAAAALVGPRAACAESSTDLHSKIGAQCARLHSEVRNAILRAGAAALTETGSSTIRMKDIAARAGIAVGTLYNHFENRDDLISLLERRHTENLVQRCHRLPPSHLSFEERLRSTICVLCEEAATAREPILSLLARSPARLLSRSGPAHELRKSPVLQFVEELIRDGSRKGVVGRFDYQLLAALLVGMVEGLECQARTSGHSWQCDADIILRTFLHGCGACGASGPGAQVRHRRANPSASRNPRNRK